MRILISFFVQIKSSFSKVSWIIHDVISAIRYCLCFLIQVYSCSLSVHTLSSIFISIYNVNVVVSGEKIMLIHMCDLFIRFALRDIQFKRILVRKTLKNWQDAKVLLKLLKRIHLFFFFTSVYDSYFIWNQHCYALSKFN